MTDDDASAAIQELEKKEQSEILKGQEAFRLIHGDQSMLKRVLDEIDTLWTDGWRHTTPGQVEIREHLYQLLLAKDEIVGRLQAIVDSGKMADEARRQRAAAQQQREAPTDDGSGRTGS